MSSALGVHSIHPSRAHLTSPSKAHSIDPKSNPGPFEAIVRNVLDPKYSGAIEVELVKTLDSALTRSGRFDKKVYFDLPNIKVN